MVRILLFCLLVVVCWPLALVVAVAYPIVWVLLLPFRLVGVVVKGVFEVVGAVFALPVRVLRGV